MINLNSISSVFPTKSKYSSYIVIQVFCRHLPKYYVIVKMIEFGVVKVHWFCKVRCSCKVRCRCKVCCGCKVRYRCKVCCHCNLSCDRKSPKMAPKFWALFWKKIAPRAKKMAKNRPIWSCCF